MKRWALFCGVMLLFAGAVSAQSSDAPKVEVFGGYSFAHLSANGLGVNFNGGSASVSWNPTPWLGIVGDFGGYHGGEDIDNGNVYTYLFGPKIALRHGPITPFVQTLFGGAHLSAGRGCEEPVLSGVHSEESCCATARVHSEIPECQSLSENSFAMTVGGGLDWNATEHLGIRLIQAEYFMTNFENTRENGARISIGGVFRW